MKRAFFSFSILFIALYCAAANLVQIADPATWRTSDLSPYVGQTVTFSCPMYVVGNNGDISISPRRIFSPTNQAIPLSPEYNSIISLNGNCRMWLDNCGYHRLGEICCDLTVYVNSTTSLRYVSGHFWGSRDDLQQLDIASLVDNDEQKHTLLVCAMNCEYYLTEQFSYGATTQGPYDLTEHQKQRAKVGSALAKINADIYGLVEVQQGEGALREIAEDLSKSTGRTFVAIKDGTSASGTFTKSGYVYDSLKVRALHAMQENDAEVKGRKKIQMFEEIATGETFLFSINHFKAKSGSGSGDNGDKGDGQGQFNATRTRESQSVIDQHKKISSAWKEKDILIMGDLNAYGKEDPIIKFLENGYYDLHREFHADSSYSYRFSNGIGYLDHAICNPTLLNQVTGMAAFHINSDESDDYTYDKSNDRTMFRCSDHDPVLVGLRLNNALSVAPSTSVNTYDVLYKGDDIIIRNAYDTLPSVRSFAAIYTLDGHLVSTCEQKLTNGQSHEIPGVQLIESNHHVIAKPREPGLYILYIYVGKADGNSEVIQRKLLVH